MVSPGVSPQPLPGPPSATVVLDVNGNGTVSLGPTRVREHWQPASANVKVSTNNNEAVCRVYAGPAPADAYFQSSTLTGSTGDSCPLGIDIQTGMSVWAVWQDGDPGATATLVVPGTYTIGAPSVYPFAFNTGFLNKIVAALQAGNTIINSKGVFVYSGPPAKGNLIFSVAGVGGTDKFGNTYGPEVNAGKWSAATGNQLQHFGIDSNGQIYLYDTNDQLWMFSQQGDGGVTTRDALFFEDGSGNVVCAIVGGAGTPAGTSNRGFVGQIQAIIPANTSGDGETWHDLAPTLAGWAQTGAGNDPLQYKLDATNRVQITGDISGGALAAGAQTIATIPAAYRPPTNPTPAMFVSSTGRTITTDVPNLTVTTAGLLQVRNAQGATRLQFGGISYPLDSNSV
jgi:hypothetical protein